MKVSTSVEGNPLRLDDIRRMFRETGGWDGQCLVDVYKSPSGHCRITVQETDAERPNQPEPQETPK